MIRLPAADHQLGITRTRNPIWAQSAFLGLVIAPLSYPAYVGKVILPIIMRALWGLFLALWGLGMALVGIVGMTVAHFLIYPVLGLAGHLRINVQAKDTKEG